MATQPPVPKEGDIRINGDHVEYYTAGEWVPQEELPDDQLPPDMRDSGPDEDLSVR